MPEKIRPGFKTIAISYAFTCAALLYGGSQGDTANHQNQTALGAAMVMGGLVGGLSAHAMSGGGRPTKS